MASSYADRLSDSKVMQVGMESNEDSAAERGWTPVKTIKLGTVRSDAANLNAEQERLKAELKMKTEALDAKMKELETLMKEARKVVKLTFPQSQWKEFGVTAKH